MEPTGRRPTETQEWLDALESVLTQEGTERAHYLLERLIEKARRSGAYLPYSATTAYINTIPPGRKTARPVIMRWSTVSVRMCAGTPWRWCYAPTSIQMSAAILPALHQRRRSMTSDTIISGMPRRKARRRSAIRTGPFVPWTLCVCFPAGRTIRGTTR